MQTQKSHKIDLSAEYPCPCRRRGQLTPIALTEAFGCDRCQHIFVVQDNGHTIEQLVNHYPYKKVWRWTGHQWSTAHPMLVRGYLPFMILMVLGLALLLLIISFRSIPTSEIAFRILIVLVIVMLGLMLWVTRRR